MPCSFFEGTDYPSRLALDTAQNNFKVHMNSAIETLSFQIPSPSGVTEATMSSSGYVQMAETVRTQKLIRVRSESPPTVTLDDSCSSFNLMQEQNNILRAIRHDMRRGQQQILEGQQKIVHLLERQSIPAGQLGKRDREENCPTQGDLSSKRIRLIETSTFFASPKSEHQRPSGEIPSVLPSIEFDEEQTAIVKQEAGAMQLICAHCGLNGHELADCQIPDPTDGFILGCPRHNTRDHSMDECPRSWGDMTLLNHYLIYRRACLPPILTAKHSWVLTRIRFSRRPKDQGRKTRFPWTAAFSKQMARDAVYMTQAQTGLLVPEHSRKHDPATTDLACVQRLYRAGQMETFRG
jgi:hypothetical protein